MDDFMDFWKAFGGLQGFEVLKKYIKQSNDLCRTLASILQERVDLEITYSKSLAKISGKVTKSASQCLGSMEGAWQAVGTSMGEEAEYHKQLASSIEEFVLQPMRNLAENYHKSRKPIESAVERTSNALMKLRADESRLKKVAFTQAKDAEKNYESLASAKLGTRGAQTDKEVVKLEKKSRGSDETARKSEKDYYDCALKAEASRLDWEAVVYKSCAQLQVLEVDRLKQCHEMLKKYHYNLASITNNHKNLSEKLEASMTTVNIRDDMRKVIDQRGCGPTQPEQLLVDFYAEDMSTAMDRERRQHCLKIYHSYAWQDWEREKKSKEGIEKLLSVYKTNPTFSDKDNQEETRHKLISADALLTYLEVCQYKFNCSLALTQKVAKPTHRLSSYLEFTKDRYGLTQSILRMPMSELAFTAADGFISVTNRHHQTGDHRDGGMEYADFDDDFDEDFDDPPVQPSISTSTRAQPSRHASTRSHTVTTLPASNNSYSVNNSNPTPRGSSLRCTSTTSGARNSNSSDKPVVGWCKAMYDFDARDGAELSMKPGDIISIYSKADATWWEGELNGRSGLFPSNYVEEF